MPETMTDNAFGVSADRYDLLVDWPRRLEREAPFFRKLFHQHRVGRLADVACGTGRHAALFHTWGIDVEASDISLDMIEHCRLLHGEQDGLHWLCRSFCETPQQRARFDAVLCLGNSLALAGDRSSVERAVGTMISMARPGGIGVIQVLNRSRPPGSKVIWQKVRRGLVAGRDTLLIKAMIDIGERDAVTLLEVELDQDPPRWREETATLLRLGLDELRDVIGQAGGRVVGVFGDYTGEVFSAVTSADLILVWQRGG